MTERFGPSGLRRRGGIAFIAAGWTFGVTAALAGVAIASDQTQFGVIAGAL